MLAREGGAGGAEGGFAGRLLGLAGGAGGGSALGRWEGVEGSGVGIAIPSSVF